MRGGAEIMKKLFIPFVLCSLCFTTNAKADNDIWSQYVDPTAILNVIKNTTITQQMDSVRFLEYIETHWAPTFKDVMIACKISVPEDADENICKTFLTDIANEHNKLVNNLTDKQHKPCTSEELNQIHATKGYHDGNKCIATECADPSIFTLGDGVCFPDYNKAKQRETGSQA